MRRVVIGDGKGDASGVLFDGDSSELVRHSEYPTVSVAELWRTAAGHPVDATDRATERAGQRPGPGESRFYRVRIDPGPEIPLHATPTVDYHCVVAGEVTCLLERGEVTVRAGDVLVLQGEQHGWVNRGDEPFISVAVMVNTESE